MSYEGNRYAGMGRPKKPSMFAQWVDPVLSTTGAVVGTFMGAPGGPAGMAAGASAGYKAGHAIGDTAEGVANKDLSVGRVVGNARDSYRNASDMDNYTSISPQGGGTQPTLPVPEQSVPMENQQILQRFMQNPRDPMFQSFSGRQQWNPYTDQTPYGMKAFANGGLVTGPVMDMASQWAQMDPVQRAMLQAQQAVGNGPVYPTVENGQLGALQQAKHPTLEALASLLPDILGSLPKPANPKNTKAIGAWAPFAGQALAAPATIAQARRKAANAPIEQANTTAQADYEAKRTAYEARKTALSNTLVGNATKPFAPDNSVDGPTVDIPGVGRVPATSGIAGDYLRKKHPELFPASVSSQERAAKQEGEQGDIEQLAHDIASFQAEPVVSMSGRSAQFGSQVRNRVNQLLREHGSPYSWNTLATLWNEKSKFYNTQNQQRFTQLRQSAVTVRQHINQFKQFYQQYASRVNPKDMRLLAGGMFGAARQGLLGPDAAASAQALEVTANALATETAMVLSGGYAPQAVQMEEARTMVDKALGQRSTKAGMDALEKLLEARIKNAVGATPFAGGRTNPYLIEASPLEGWGSAAQQEQPKPSGWKPKGAKLVEGK